MDDTGFFSLDGRTLTLISFHVCWKISQKILLLSKSSQMFCATLNSVEHILAAYCSFPGASSFRISSYVAVLGMKKDMELGEGGG